MTAALFITLIVVDIALLACVFLINRKQDAHIELIEELTEERRMLGELRSAVHEELESAQSSSRKMLDRVTQIAAEAEHEVQSGAKTISSELEGVVDQLTVKFENPLKEINKRQAYLENLLKRVEREKSSLQRLVSRGEKICKFFDKNVPYEDILHEIEDKKYSDARHMLARGTKPEAIAQELGMSISEVNIVAGLSGR